MHVVKKINTIKRRFVLICVLEDIWVLKHYGALLYPEGQSQ